MSLFYKWGGGIGPDHPRVIEAYDEFLVTEDDEELIDAAAGAAVANLGHSVPSIPAIADETLSEVGYLSLSHFSHEAPERLAGRLAELSPGDLEATFLVGSGSEATETAIKLARSYHETRGNPHKSLVIGRWQSYHGSTLGALSASGNTARREPFESMLIDWPHIPPAYPFRWPYEGSPAEQAERAAVDLEAEIRQHGADRVAALVVEPIGGASIPAAKPHPAYYREVRRICDQYDVLFIADEVMTGFGRTGERFGVEHYGVVPDMMTVGKAMSGGYAPISATVIRSEIADEFAADTGHSFPHGHTYSGHPASAAIAAEVVNRYTDNLLERVRRKGTELRDRLSALEDHPMIGDLRQVGLLLGIEFVADTETNEPFDPGLAVSEQVYDATLNQGIYTYPGGGSVDGVAGDHLMLAPPLTISATSIDTIASGVSEAVERVWTNLDSA